MNDQEGNCDELCLNCLTWCELWELELSGCKAVSDNRCQEEMTRGVSDMDRCPYPEISAEPSSHNLGADMDTVF